MMNRKKVRNPNIIKPDNSYQLLLEVERICNENRKFYNKNRLIEALEIIRKVIKLEDK